MIIGSYFIEHLFFTFFAFMFHHPSFIFFIINSYWFHKPHTFRKSISRKIFIQMFWIKTKRTVISSTSLGMFFNRLSTIFTNKSFIEHYKWHISFFSRIKYYFYSKKINKKIKQTIFSFDFYYFFIELVHYF